MSVIPEHSYVRLDDDVTLHYLDAGEGEAVLFIHGSGPGASGHSNFKQKLSGIFSCRLQGYRAGFAWLWLEQ